MESRDRSEPPCDSPPLEFSVTDTRTKVMIGITEYRWVRHIPNTNPIGRIQVHVLAAMPYILWWFALNQSIGNCPHDVAKAVGKMKVSGLGTLSGLDIETCNCAARTLR